MNSQQIDEQLGKNQLHELDTSTDTIWVIKLISSTFPTLYLNHHIDLEIEHFFSAKVRTLLCFKTKVAAERFADEWFVTKKYDDCAVVICKELKQNFSNHYFFND